MKQGYYYSKEFYENRIYCYLFIISIIGTGIVAATFGVVPTIGIALMIAGQSLHELVQREEGL